MGQRISSRLPTAENGLIDLDMISLDKLVGIVKQKLDSPLFDDGEVHNDIRTFPYLAILFDKDKIINVDRDAPCPGCPYHARVLHPSCSQVLLITFTMPAFLCAAQNRPRVEPRVLKHGWVEHPSCSHCGLRRLRLGASSGSPSGGRFLAC